MLRAGQFWQACRSDYFAVYIYIWGFKGPQSPSTSIVEFKGALRRLRKGPTGLKWRGPHRQRDFPTELEEVLYREWLAGKSWAFLPIFSTLGVFGWPNVSIFHPDLCHSPLRRNLYLNFEHLCLRTSFLRIPIQPLTWAATVCFPHLIVMSVSLPSILCRLRETSSFIILNVKKKQIFRNAETSMQLISLFIYF